jgi:undecaprenyl-diphosphatase
VLPGRWRWLPIAIATLNAIARVYLGAHNPLDVVGGAAIGIALGAVISLAVEAAGGSGERSAPRETAQSRQS